MRALPDTTAALLRTIDTLPESAGLMLAGGTAIALRIGHRRSEDLDFVFPRGKLPRRKVEALVDRLRRERSVSPLPNVAAEQDFLNSGLELADYQQDYLVDGVKMTCFAPDPARLADRIEAEPGVAGLRSIRVATLGSLFLMKAVALTSRTVLRDYFDVYTLIEKHGFTFEQVLQAADDYASGRDTLKMRLINATPRADDPGVELLEGIAPTFDALQAYFAGAVDRHERNAARRKS